MRRWIHIERIDPAAGDLLFGSVATGLFELVWNYKKVGGKLLL